LSLTLIKEPLEKLPRPVAYLVNSLINEIRYILNIYQNQNKKPVTKIILTGGSSFLAGLTDYFYSIFNIRAFIGDPWARVIHPVEIDSLLKELGPRFAVSVGLAMREIG
jgi:Tfp pilus assembly PilM family ATPase